jgi:hypothetical protein
MLGFPLTGELCIMALRFSVSLACLCLIFHSLAQQTPAKRTPKWAIVFDFVDRLSAGSGIENNAGATSTVASAGGQPLPVLFEHPNAPGRPRATLSFSGVALPVPHAKEKVVLHFSIAIRDGFPKAEHPEADGCTFLVRINDREVFTQRYAEQRWQQARVDLTAYAGQTVTVTFQTDPLQNSAFDWAVWGRPQIWIEGRRAKVKGIARVPFLKISALLQEPVRSRLVERREDAAACSLIAVMDRHLDLAAQLKDYAPGAGEPPVPAAPELVVGEGEDPANHTLVKILNSYGIADVQFLAYPPEIRGGVSVNAGRFARPGRCIVATPLTDRKTREIRLFNPLGGLVRAFAPDRSIAPPYVVAVGDFLPDHPGDEIAVASRSQPAGKYRAGIYSAGGALLKTVVLPEGAADELALSVRHSGPSDRLIAFLRAARRAYLVDPTTGSAVARDLPFLSGETGLYESAFHPDVLLATGPGETFSTLTRIAPSGEPRTLDLGAAENRFWLQWYGPGWPDVPDGKYVRKSVFRHLRTDGASPAGNNPALATDPHTVAGPAFLQRFEPLFAGYDRDTPALWEPCFTHRQGKGGMQAWRDVTEEATGYPKYMMLTRNNHPVEYGEFGTVDFNASTYAFDLPALDNLYVLPLRAFLRRLAVPFRRNPEHMAGLEPNHEHEIAVEAESSMGDYNPRMIQGFFRYLTERYGRDLKGLNAALKTPFASYFDAPRAWDRGDWDAYAPDNPFYREWIAYNRYVVNRRLAQTFREALLAGFPPEIIKCHQIPDTYAIGNLQAFSAVTARFTPIDYALNAGTGYGFTRYGVWYNKPHDALQDAHAAGFDLMSLGEYQALTPDNTVAYEQLKFIAEHGGASVHCMLWPQEHDRGYNASMDYAVRRLIREDAPKPGVTGGVGQVRAVAVGNRRFDIACVGTGPAHTGLLKSLTADGAWEGTVYVVPFHAHVDVQPVAFQGTLRAGRGRVVCGPLDGLDSGSQIEIAFRARTAASPGALSIRVFRGDRELPGLQAQAAVVRNGRFYRYTLRVQLPVEDIRIVLAPGKEASGITVDRLTVTRQTEKTPKLTKGVFTGQRHRGGVTFDLLDRAPSAGNGRP